MAHATSLPAQLDSPQRLLQLRCSALPLAFLCPGSVHIPEGELLIDAIEETAQTGTAAHEALRPIVEGGEPPWDQIQDMADRWGIDRDELAALTSMGAKLWSDVAGSFPNAATERAFAHTFDGLGFRLTGHIDILSMSAEHAHGADWKTGRADSNFKAQLAGYALLIYTELLSVAQVAHNIRVQFTALWVRTREATHYGFSIEDLLGFSQRIRDEIVDWDGVYHPNRSCWQCKRALTCEARIKHQAHALRVFQSADLDAQIARLPLLPDDKQIEIYHQSKLVERLAKEAQDSIKAGILQRGTPLQSDDTILDVVDESKESIETTPAWDVLEEHGFTHEMFCRTVRISKTEMNAITAKAAGRGKGASAVRALAAALTAAGAIKTTTTKKFEERRK